MAGSEIITKEDLGRIVQAFSGFWNRITSLGDLEKIAGHAFPCDKNTDEYVSVQAGTLNSSTKTYTKTYIISYVMPGKGTPLEVKIDEIIYSKLTLTGRFSFPKYELLGRDQHGNITQERQFPSLDSSVHIDNIRYELRRLKLVV